MSLLPAHVICYPTTENCAQLIQNEHTDIIKHLANYCYQTFKIGDSTIDNFFSILLL